MNGPDSINSNKTNDISFFTPVQVDTKKERGSNIFRRSMSFHKSDIEKSVPLKQQGIQATTDKAKIPKSRSSNRLSRMFNEKINHEAKSPSMEETVEKTKEQGALLKNTVTIKKPGLLKDKKIMEIDPSTIDFKGAGGAGKVYSVARVDIEKTAIIKEPLNQEKTTIKDIEREVRNTHLVHDFCKKHGFLDENGEVPGVCNEVHQVRDLSQIDPQFKAGLGSIGDYYNGSSLENFLAKNTLSHDQKKEIAIQLIQGLSYIHQAGLAHRDLKLENICIKTETQPDGTVKVKPYIIDFGNARILDDLPNKFEKNGELSEAFQHGIVSSRYWPDADYMKINQNAFLTKESNVSMKDIKNTYFQVNQAADRFSLGVVLYQLFSEPEVGPVLKESGKEEMTFKRRFPYESKMEEQNRFTETLPQGDIFGTEFDDRWLSKECQPQEKAIIQGLCHLDMNDRMGLETALAEFRKKTIS